MSKIAFDFNNYKVIVSNHGWYEIHDRELRDKIIKADLVCHEIVGKTKKGGLIVKEKPINDSLLYSGKVMTGFVDAEHEDNIRTWCKEMLFNYLTQIARKK